MDSILWGAFLLLLAGVAALAALSVIIGAILAPALINKADKALSVLLPSNESLFQGLPVSYTRLGSYGRVLLLRNTRWYQSRVFDHRPDRERAITDAPAGLRRTLTALWLGVVAMLRRCCPASDFPAVRSLMSLGAAHA
ncbi:hypothetical protein B4O83_00020 [Chromohalobacter israelensis]|nr:hypothetical protein B4O83_00020 [Chromohalobacter salexigens]